MAEGVVSQKEDVLRAMQTKGVDHTANIELAVQIGTQHNDVSIGPGDYSLQSTELQSGTGTSTTTSLSVSADQEACPSRNHTSINIQSGPGTGLDLDLKLHNICINLPEDTDRGKVNKTHADNIHNLKQQPRSGSMQSMNESETTNSSIDSVNVIQSELTNADLSIGARTHKLPPCISKDSIIQEAAGEASDSGVALDHLSASASSSTPPSSGYKKSSSHLRKLNQDALRNLKLDHVCWQCGGSARSSNSTMSRSSSSSSEEIFEIEDLPGAESLSHQSEHSVDDSRVYFLTDCGFSTFTLWDNDDEDEDSLDDYSLLEELMFNSQREDMSSMRPKNVQEPPPLYPHRPLRTDECQVCLEVVSLRRRICCDFKICKDCMSTYVTMKVNEAKLQIECPNDRCNILVHREEVNDRLSNEMKAKFAKFLVDANMDPCKKTCPSCSEVYTIDPTLLSDKKNVKQGIKVFCPQCKLQWCFLCQAPFHTDVSCKQYRKGDKMVKKWAKERSYGQSNAQRCPKCKIFIQKVHGCDHMKCTRCHTDFCYRCGDRYISVKLLGNHWSRFSLFGCKYRLLPQKPGLRRLIRGANFAARVVAGIVLAGLGLAAGAILVGASVVIVPGYGVFVLNRHLRNKKRRKERMRAAKLDILRREQFRIEGQNAQVTSSSYEESEVENPDTHQVQVIVHRSVSFSQEEQAQAANLSTDDDCEFYINKYTAEGTNMVVSGAGGEDSEEVIVVTDVQEIPNADGYPTVVANFVSKVAESKEPAGKVKNLSKEKKGSNSDSKSIRRESTDMKKVVRDVEKVEVLRNPADTELKEIDIVLKEKPCDSMLDEKTSCLSEDLSGTERPTTECDVLESESRSSDDNIISNSTIQNGLKYLEVTSEPDDSKDLFPDAKLCNVVVGDNPDSTKSGGNGCFGNIFSKRNSTQTGLSDDPNTKLQLSSSQKKISGLKAATWEKCKRDAVQSLLRSNPLDQSVDFKNSSVKANISPASATLANLKYMDILNLNEVKPQKTLATFDVKASRKSTQSGIVHEGDSIKERSSWDAKTISRDGKVDTKERAQDFPGDSETPLESSSDHCNAFPDPGYDGCCVSEDTYVTYL